MKHVLLPLAALIAAPLSAQTAPIAKPDAAKPDSATPISPARLAADVKTLASDAFEGRAPGTPGEAKTIDWLVAQFKAMGLQPGGRDGSWTQPVPLVHTRLRHGHDHAGRYAGRAGRGHLSQHRAPGRSRAGSRRRRWSSSAMASARPSAGGTISRASTSRARSRCSWSTTPISRRSRAMIRPASSATGG